MRNLIVDKKYNEKKLNTYLLEQFSGLNINSFYRTLRKKDIRVNNVKTNQNITLYTGDQITIFINDNILFKTNEIKIVYEDDNIIVFNKPNSLEVTGENSLTTMLLNSNKYEFIQPCHRLDRNTTGLVLFAKNKESLDILLSKFKKHEIEKHYICTVIGIPKTTKDTITAYLFKDSKKSFVYISDIPKKGYQKIITSYSILTINQKDKLTKLDVTLHTGKTHQIRAHLAHIGLPILGDGKYGMNEINKKFNKKTQELYSNRFSFHFSSDAGILNYLNNKTITLK